MSPNYALGMVYVCEIYFIILFPVALQEDVWKLKFRQLPSSCGKLEDNCYFPSFFYSLLCLSFYFSTFLNQLRHVLLYSTELDFALKDNLKYCCSHRIKPNNIYWYDNVWFLFCICLMFHLLFQYVDSFLCKIN